MQLFNPLSLDEALSCLDFVIWHTTMNKEYDSLIKNNTWALVDSPSNQSIVSFKWLFCRKYKYDGSIDCYKVHFVVSGFSQRDGIDYYETFFPVIKMTSFHVLQALATIHNFSMHQMNVMTTFINGDLTKEIYISQPLASSILAQLQKFAACTSSFINLNKHSVSIMNYLTPIY